MRHLDQLIRALPRMALLAAALVAVTAVWGTGADTARAEGDDGDSALSTTHVAVSEGFLTFEDGNGRYWARVRADEATITFYQAGSSQPVWTAAVALAEDSDAGALVRDPGNASGTGTALRELAANLPDGAKVFHDADTRTYEYVRPLELVPPSVRLTMSGATVMVDGASPVGGVIYARFDAETRDEYVATVRGTEVEVRFYPRGSSRHAWSAFVQLDEPVESIDPALAAPLIEAIRSITLAELQPPSPSESSAGAVQAGESERMNGGNTVVIAAPEAEQARVPQQAAPDEGGTGVNNFDREEWYEFSILLAPFLVLVTFILILMFMWDRHSGEEG